MVSPVSCREGSPSSCAVQEVKVLPECQYKSKMGYAHDLKPYWGHKEVGVIARDNRQLSMPSLSGGVVSPLPSGG